MPDTDTTLPSHTLRSAVQALTDLATRYSDNPELSTALDSIRNPLAVMLGDINKEKSKLLLAGANSISPTLAIYIRSGRTELSNAEALRIADDFTRIDPNAYYAWAFMTGYKKAKLSCDCVHHNLEAFYQYVARTNASVEEVIAGVTKAFPSQVAGMIAFARAMVKSVSDGIDDFAEPHGPVNTHEAHAEMREALTRILQKGQ